MEKTKTGKLATEENKHKIFDYCFDFLIFERLKEFEKTELEPEEIIELKRINNLRSKLSVVHEKWERSINVAEQY